MPKQKLSNVDTAWLRMEHPANLMMITAVMGFSQPMDVERLKATFEHRLLARFNRFRQRVIEPALPLAPPYWEDYAEFDLDEHVQRITLPPPGDQTALQEVVSQLMSAQLDFSKPLWQVHVVENYGDGCALIARLHHCIADGIALMHVLLSLTDTDPDAPWPSTEPRRRRKRSRSPWKTLLQPARSALQITTQVANTLAHQGFETLLSPSRALELARLGADGATALGRLVLRWPDPKTVFKGPLEVPKRAAWSAPIPLRDVKTVGQAIGGTVNDVLLTAVAGALRRYLLGRGESVEGLNFRAVVPVNLRPLDAEPELGNKFSLVFLSLPVGIADPSGRLLELKRRMDELKGSQEAIVAFGILNTIGMAPSEIHNIVVNIFGTKATAVMTNVPGPCQQLYLAGAPLDTIMFWVPQSGRLGLGVSIMSYAGRVWLGVATDQGLAPDPETIIDAFHAEFDALLERARKKKAGPGQTVQAMVALLDQTIDKVDEILEDRGADEAPALCQARTKAGKPCRNRPLPGSSFCRVHQKRAETAPE